MGRPERAREKRADSPLSALRGILRLYCAVGVIPGRLSRDACSFSVHCCRHLKTAGVVAAGLSLYSLAVIFIHLHPEAHASSGGKGEKYTSTGECKCHFG